MKIAQISSIYLSIPPKTHEGTERRKPASRLTNDAVKGSETLRLLSEVGVDLDAATHQLEDEGIQKFVKAFDQLMNRLEEKRVAAIREPVDVETVAGKRQLNT